MLVDTDNIRATGLRVRTPGGVKSITGYSDPAYCPYEALDEGPSSLHIVDYHDSLFPLSGYLYARESGYPAWDGVMPDRSVPCEWVTSWEGEPYSEPGTPEAGDLRSLDGHELGTETNRYSRLRTSVRMIGPGFGYSWVFDLEMWTGQLSDPYRYYQLLWRGLKDRGFHPLGVYERSEGALQTPATLTIG